MSDFGKCQYQDMSLSLKDRQYAALCEIQYELSRVVLTTEQMFNNIAGIVDEVREGAMREARTKQYEED